MRWKTKRVTEARQLRWLLRKDVDWAEHVSEASFGERTDFWRLLRRRNRVAFVLCRDDVRLGYLIVEWRRRAFRLIEFAIDPAERRRGHGTRMLAEFQRHVAEARCRRGLVETAVPERCLAAQLFLRARGFVAVRTLHGAHGDRYVFRRRL